mmetsp:Transcript_31936/g.68971  ORF Transcript_31936/g.68971 Transcript_31936/m.68971 type:complete len:101 (-) Transcript_31936:519-821(-)
MTIHGPVQPKVTHGATIFFKAPPLEPPYETIELGPAKKLGHNSFHELVLIHDAERTAGGDPLDGVAAFSTAEHCVELFGEVWLAGTAFQTLGGIDNGIGG